MYFVDVDVVRFVHRECDRPGKCVGSDGDLADELLRAGLDVLLADVLEEFGPDRAGRDDGRPDVVGFDFLAKTFRQRPNRELRDAIDRGSGIDDMPVDEETLMMWPDFRSFLCGSAAAMP